MALKVDESLRDPAPPFRRHLGPCRRPRPDVSYRRQNLTSKPANPSFGPLGPRHPRTTPAPLPIVPAKAGRHEDTLMGWPSNTPAAGNGPLWPSSPAVQRAWRHEIQVLRGGRLQSFLRPKDHNFNAATSPSPNASPTATSPPPSHQPPSPAWKSKTSSATQNKPSAHRQKIACNPAFQAVSVAALQDSPGCRNRPLAEGEPWANPFCHGDLSTIASSDTRVILMRGTNLGAVWAQTAAGMRGFGLHSIPPIQLASNPRESCRHMNAGPSSTCLINASMPDMVQVGKNRSADPEGPGPGKIGPGRDGPSPLHRSRPYKGVVFRPTVRLGKQNPINLTDQT